MSQIRLACGPACLDWRLMRDGLQWVLWAVPCLDHGSGNPCVRKHEPVTRPRLLVECLPQHPSVMDMTQNRLSNKPCFPQSCLWSWTIRATESKVEHCMMDQAQVIKESTHLCYHMAGHCPSERTHNTCCMTAFLRHFQPRKVHKEIKRFNGCWSWWRERVIAHGLNGPVPIHPCKYSKSHWALQERKFYTVWINSQKHSY